MVIEAEIHREEQTPVQIEEVNCALWSKVRTAEPGDPH